MTDQPPPPRRFQFRLRTLLLLMVVAAIILSGLCAPSTTLGLLTACTVPFVVATILASVAISSRGAQRAFCVGALVPGLVFLSAYSPIVLLAARRFQEGGIEAVTAISGPVAPLRATVALHLGVSVVMGLLAVGVRWLVESGNRADA